MEEKRGVVVEVGKHTQNKLGAPAHRIVPAFGPPVGESCIIRAPPRPQLYSMSLPGAPRMLWN